MNDEIKSECGFIYKLNFWVMVLGFVSVYASAKGWIGEPERNFLAGLAGAFVTVQQLNRVTDKRNTAMVAVAQKQVDTETIKSDTAVTVADASVQIAKLQANEVPHGE